MNVLTRTTVGTMHIETKYLRLRTPVTLGSRFGDWQVTWLGGWSRDRLHYLVMVARLPSQETCAVPREKNRGGGGDEHDR